MSDGLDWLHELNDLRKLADARAVENLALTAANAKLQAELAEANRLWITEQKARLEQSTFVELYSSANVKVELDELRKQLAEAKDELENDPGDCADVRLGFENERLAAELAEAKAECERLREENTHLRAALAVSKDPCVYCQLPKEEMAKCKYGFPGCARMDDLTGCPEFGAMLNEQHLREENEKLRAQNVEIATAHQRLQYACDIFEKNSEDAVEREAELTRLKADLAAARRDGERLDYLIQKSGVANASRESIDAAMEKAGE